MLHIRICFVLDSRQEGDSPHGKSNHDDQASFEPRVCSWSMIACQSCSFQSGRLFLFRCDPDACESPQLQPDFNPRGVSCILLYHSKTVKIAKHSAILGIKKARPASRTLFHKKWPGDPRQIRIMSAHSENSSDRSIVQYSSRFDISQHLLALSQHDS